MEFFVIMVGEIKECTPAAHLAGGVGGIKECMLPTMLVKNACLPNLLEQWPSLKNACMPILPEIWFKLEKDMLQKCAYLHEISPSLCIRSIMVTLRVDFDYF